MKNNIYSEKDLINISQKYKELKIKEPTKNMYINAQNHKILDAYKLNNNLSEIKKYLNYHGPIIFYYKYGKTIDNLLLFKKKLETLNLIINKEGDISDSDKNSINEYITILNKYIKNNDNKYHFRSYYDEINNIKFPSNIQNLISKYFNKYNKEIYTNVFKNSNKKDLTLKFPTELINESEKYCKEKWNRLR